MFLVDKERFTAHDFQGRVREVAASTALQHVEGQLIALCLNHPVSVLSYLYYVKDRDGSVLLLNGETPLETALEYAEEAGCTYLIYGEDKVVYTLDKEKRGNHDPCLCQFSSGTTGKPKVIRRTWDRVYEEINHYNQALNASQDEQPVLLVPVSHSFGLIAGFMSAVERGVEPIIVRGKNPKFAGHLIQTCSKSITYGVPFLFHVVLSLANKDFRFHRIVTSGSPLSETLLNRLKEKSDEIIQQYGNTELGCVSIARNINQSTEVGKPLSHLSVQLSQEADHDQEVLVQYKGETIHTRDYGSFSTDGTLHILGRLDDMINVSGQKVVPYEVESVIDQIEGVSEVVVYKKKHPVWGEAVKAMIIADDHLTKAYVKEWCKKRLPPYKVPSHIQFTHEIPKNKMGKISRKLLQEQERVVNE